MPDMEGLLGQVQTRGPYVFTVMLLRDAVRVLYVVYT